MQAAVILAAGKGTRMKSDLPKVLHKVCGRTMLEHVLSAVYKAQIESSIVIAGHQYEMVKSFVKHDNTHVLCQSQQLGTAHALLQAETVLNGCDGDVVVLCGDTPLLSPKTIKGLLDFHHAQGAYATLLTSEVNDPAGYGRIIRGPEGYVSRVVEHKDATPAERLVKEINTGVYCFKIEGLFGFLKEISCHNVQGEYYLPDIVEVLLTHGLKVAAQKTDNNMETLGINDRKQLAQVGAIMRLKQLEELMESGVSIIDPSSTFVDVGVEIGRDTIIYPFTIIEGQTRIGSSCTIGPSSRIIDAEIEDGVTVLNSIIISSQIKANSNIGPFAYVRPDCVIGPGAKIGDFVEVKKSTVGTGSKIPHLSYIGDSVIGEHVNVGAGTITCNYDGVKKWQTLIRDKVFIGSNTNLVAPVEVGEGAVIAAGSTITKDVPAKALGVARERQKNLQDWKTRKNKNQ